MKINKIYFIFLITILCWLIGCINSKIIEIPTSTPILITSTLTNIPISTFTQTVEPITTPVFTTAILTDNIPTPIFYSCIESEEIACINKDTPVQEAMTRMIYIEGGELHPQVAVNAIQNFSNMLKIAWGCWNPDANTVCAPTWSLLNPNHFSYDNITRDILERLLAYVASTPYRMRTTSHPNWNAWEMPFPKKSITESSYENNIYNAIYDSVGKWLNNPNDEIILKFYNSLYTPAPILEKNKCLAFVYIRNGIGDAGRIPELEKTAGYIYRTTLLNDITYNFYYLILPHH